MGEGHPLPHCGCLDVPWWLCWAQDKLVNSLVLGGSVGSVGTEARQGAPFSSANLLTCAALQEERKVPPPIPKKPPKGKSPITREKSLDLPDRQRQEARRRLMAAKRAASFRQNSATERADSIEIYIPEAQTRL